MQRIIILLILFLSIGSLQAQVTFWTEDFGTGCNQGQLANAVTGTNGTWTIVTTGTNGSNANTWYISATENGNAAGACGTGCGTDRTLHLGNIDLLGGMIPADGGASYYAGGLGGEETNVRSESPTINCSGYNTITLDFLYIENGDGTLDNATLWYYDGSTWALLVDLPKTPFGSCSPQGQWTAYSIALPASANNNANVKIAFNWTNNADGSGTDPSFAVDDITLTVPSAGSPPVADFTVIDTNICVGDCIDFTDASTNTPTSWDWTFPGGTPNSSNIQNPVNICYNIAGDYESKLVVHNASGSDSITQTIHVYAIPTAGISSTDTTICNGDNITLTALGGGTYFWGGGQSTTNINVSPTTNTTYSVTVTSNGCIDVASLDIIVNALPNISITGTSSICDGESTTLTGNNGNSYLWGGGQSTNSINVSPSTNTWYYVTGTDGNGCSNIDSMEVTVNPSPIAIINGASSICIGDSTTLTASGGTGTYNYLWDGSSSNAAITVSPSSLTSYYVTVSIGSCSDSASITINVDTLPIISISGTAIICENDTAILYGNGGISGNYVWSYMSQTTDSIQVTPTSTTNYTVTGSDGTCYNTSTFQVTVNPAPNININGINSICEGDSTTLTASGATTYLWSTLSGSPSITVSPTSTTSYSVTGTDGGCEGTAEILVTVNPIPNAVINGDTVICFGESAILTASGGSGYLWNTTQSTSSITVSPATTQTYSVTVSNGPCIDTATITLIVHPLPIVDAGNDTTIIFGDNAYLYGSGGPTYTWSPSATLSCSDCQDPVASPEESTLYTLLITDANGCSNTDEVWVYIEYNCGDIFVPTAFSPNGDGYNDVLYIRGNCIDNLTFKIFDRWGEKVFESKNPTDGWDGEFRGQIMNGGVFSYYYSGTQIDGSSISGKGNVTLIR